MPLLEQQLLTISVHSIILVGIHAVLVVQLLVFTLLFTYTSIQPDFHARWCSF